MKIIQIVASEPLEEEGRTAGDMVREMLAKGRSWIDILAVASVVRNGKWRKEVEEILIKKGAMPKDPAVQKLQLEGDRTIHRASECKYIAPKKINKFA